MCLVICTTPLQMLISCKLVNFKIKRKKIDILILTGNLNEKYIYYIDILKNNSLINEVCIIEIENKGKNISNKFINLNKIRRWCKDRLYSVAYLASIDNFYIHFILDKCCIQEVYTFDDGTMNIVDNSDYFLSRETLFSRFARIFLDLKWNLARIKMQTRKHYTIYHSMKNIVENTENIDLFEINYLDDIKTKQEEIDIYIGQPFLNKESSIKIYKKLMVENKNIKYYLHPREDSSFVMSQLSLENILQSDLIVEDFIILLLEQGYRINLFTISSSAGLNLYSIKNITVYFILEESLANEVAGFFNLIKRRALRTINI